MGGFACQMHLVVITVGARDNTVEGRDAAKPQNIVVDAFGAVGFHSHVIGWIHIAGRDI